MLRLFAPLLLVGWLVGHGAPAPPLLSPDGKVGALTELSPGASLVLLLGADDGRSEPELAWAASRLQARGVQLVVVRLSAPPSAPLAAASPALTLYDPVGALRQRHPSAGALLQDAAGRTLCTFPAASLGRVELERALQTIDALARARHALPACPTPP